MVSLLATVPMTLLDNGDFGGAIQWVMRDYIGFGILYMLFGIVLVALVYSKTNSYGISGVVFVVYTSILAASGAVPAEIANYFILLIGLIIAILAVKIWMSR